MTDVTLNDTHSSASVDFEDRELVFRNADEVSPNVNDWRVWKGESISRTQGKITGPTSQTTGQCSQSVKHIIIK